MRTTACLICEVRGTRIAVPTSAIERVVEYEPLPPPPGCGPWVGSSGVDHSRIFVGISLPGIPDPPHGGEPLRRALLLTASRSGGERAERAPEERLQLAIEIDSTGGFDAVATDGAPHVVAGWRTPGGWLVHGRTRQHDDLPCLDAAALHGALSGGALPRPRD